MTAAVGVYGFGRIGRCTFVHITLSGRDDILAPNLNATRFIKPMSIILRNDSIHGQFPSEITIKTNSINLVRGPLDVMANHDASKLDWNGCDIVLECTGKFNDGRVLAFHMRQGAKAVIISVPAKNIVHTIAYGVDYNNLVHNHTMISDSSCTANCLAPIAKVLNTL